MRRGILALAALAAAAAIAAIAQPVAKLDVVPKAKPPSQHDRIEAKLDQMLELLRAAPAKPPAPPAPPSVPKPADPSPLPGVDARIAIWCAEGLDLVQIRMWKLPRTLTSDELEFAYTSGCPRPGAPPGGPADPPAGPVQPSSGFDLGVGGGTVIKNVVAAGIPYTFAFTVSPGKPISFLTAFGSPGQFFTRFAARVTNAAGVVVLDIPERDAPYVPEIVVENASPGRHRLTITVNGTGTLGVQYQQRER